jgi:hypothetical protein
MRLDQFFVPFFFSLQRGCMFIYHLPKPLTTWPSQLPCCFVRYDTILGALSRPYFLIRHSYRAWQSADWLGRALQVLQPRARGTTSRKSCIMLLEQRGRYRSLMD